MIKEIKLTGALLNQQIRQKRRHYSHLHLAGRCFTGERAGQRLLWYWVRTVVEVGGLWGSTE